MEKVVGADKGAEVPVIEPNKSGEVSAAKKEDFYTKMQNKMIDLRKQSNIYLNHAPKSEKYGLCQRIRNLEDEIFGLLIEGEEIVAAFRTIRDQLVFTNKRIISIDVQGLTGLKKSFAIMPYSKVQFFTIQTPGFAELVSAFLTVSSP